MLLNLLLPCAELGFCDPLPIILILQLRLTSFDASSKILSRGEYTKREVITRPTLRRGGQLSSGTCGSLRSCSGSLEKTIGDTCPLLIGLAALASKQAISELHICCITIDLEIVPSIDASLAATTSSSSDIELLIEGSCSYRPTSEYSTLVIVVSRTSCLSCRRAYHPDPCADLVKLSADL